MEEFLRDEVLHLWIAGGWLMVPLFILGMVIYFSVFQLFFQLNAQRHSKVAPDLWGHWVDKPEDGQGEIGRIIRFTQRNVHTTHDIRIRFDEVRATLTGGLRRRMKFANIIIGTAPLTGLLGTVSGMLTTFSGIASGGGGEATVSTIASGISEALITTETGLVLAIPALFAISRIRGMIGEMELFLTRLETATLKRFLRVNAAPY